MHTISVSAFVNKTTRVNESSVLAAVDRNENVRKWLAGKQVVKRIYVPGKLVNVVIK